MSRRDSTRRKRRILLLLSSILVPTIVLVAFAVRLVGQDAELAASRAAEERRAATAELRRELAARLDTIKLREVNRWNDVRDPRLPGRVADSPVVFVAPVVQNRIVPPWDFGQERASSSETFLGLERRAEALEFVAGDPAGAVEAFRAALDRASTPHEACAARLSLGRNQFKAGRHGDAADTWERMLSDCGDIADADGIAYGLYAAERLISTGLAPGAAATLVLEAARLVHWRPPTEAHLLGSLLDRLPGDDAARLAAYVSAEIDLLERMAAFAAGFPGLARTDLPARAGLGNPWVAWGEEPWLVTTVSPAPFASPILVAVSSAIVMPVDAVLGRDPNRGTPLGDGFVGAWVEWPADRFVPESTVPGWFYATGIGLIVGATALAGYLLLRDVNREVETAELRSQFVSSVSHELKTPLTAIRMFAETLAAGRFTTEVQRAGYLDTIVNECERLSRLVDNVLDFSRIERGKKIFHMEPVLLQPVVDAASRAMKYPLEQQGFHLALAIDPGVPAVNADRDAMEQAILNLLTNAVKYSGDSRLVELSLGRQGGEAVIGVRDRGLGIASEDQARIFDKFYRVRSPEMDRIAGAGLGLTLVAHVVRAHGGRIDVASAPGAGSWFTVRLPIAAPGAGP